MKDYILNLGLLIEVVSCFKLVEAQSITDAIYIFPFVFGSLLAGTIRCKND